MRNVFLALLNIILIVGICAASETKTTNYELNKDVYWPIRVNENWDKVDAQMKLNEDGGGGGGGGYGSGECPANIITYIEGLSLGDSVKLPGGCSYNLTTSDVIDIPTGTTIDFNFATLSRTSGTPAAILQLTSTDSTKLNVIKNVVCSGTHATRCLLVDQRTQSVIPEENLIIDGVYVNFTPHITDLASNNLSPIFLFDTSFQLSNINVVVNNTTNTQATYGLRHRVDGSAEADVTYTISNAFVDVNCVPGNNFCRAADLSYQHTSAATSNIKGSVNNFYFEATGGGTGCKQTNDGGDLTNEIAWGNGVCSGDTYDFRDGSAFGDSIIANLDGVVGKQGTYNLRTTTTGTFGNFLRTDNILEIDYNALDTTNSDNNIIQIINSIGQDGDTIILPAGDITIDGDIVVTKKIHFKGQGYKNCETNIINNTGSVSIFNFGPDADGSSVSDLCITQTGNTNAVVVDCTGGLTCVEGVSFKDLNITFTNAGGGGLYAGDSSLKVDNVTVFSDSANAATQGIYVQFLSTSDNNIEVDIKNYYADITGVSGATSIYGIRVNDNGSSNTANVKISDFNIKLTEGVAMTSRGIQINGNGVTANISAPGIVHSGADDDILQFNSATVNVYGALTLPFDRKFTGTINFNDLTYVQRLEVRDFIVPDSVTADPCSGAPESGIFYNTTSNYMCFCNGTNDVQLHSPATACF